MKLFNLKFICIFSLILTSTLALKKSKIQSENHFLSKSLKSAMIKTASKFLSKLYYPPDILKSLGEKVCEQIFVIKADDTDEKIKIEGSEKTCKQIFQNHLEENPKFFDPGYYDHFLESGNLEQDILFHTRIFFEAQQEPVKKCVDKLVINSEDGKYAYMTAVRNLKKDMEVILQPLKIQVEKISNEFITSAMSTHRDRFMTEKLLKRLNHED